MKLTTEQMIELAESKDKKLDELTPEQLNQFNRFMFGDEFIDSPDFTKGKKRKYASLCEG